MRSTSFPWSNFPTPCRMYGTATVGERGQVSIPVDARKELSIEPGDKVVVFGNRLNGAVLLIKADIFEDFAGFVMTKLNKLGEHAHEVFDQFVPGAGRDDPGAGGETAADGGPADGGPANGEPADGGAAAGGAPTARRRRPA